MSDATLASADLLSRDHILSIFQSLTGCDLNNSLFFLDQYNWQIEKVLDDLDKGKCFTSRPNVDNDQELAQLISIYGQQDAEVRRSYQNGFADNSTNSKIYHEKQQNSRCGLHSLNNLFQTPNLFTIHQLDSIMHQYDRRIWSNSPDHHVSGDYEYRVLLSAIEQHGYFVQQIHIDRDPTLKSFPWDSFFGLLLNRNGRHWFTIKRFEGIYQNLDSSLSRPEHIGDKNELIRYLTFMIECGYQMYIFAVTETKIEI